MALLDDVKNYCAADEDLTPYVTAAEQYLTNAGIQQDETKALYALAVEMLVSTWYDSRNTDPSESNIPQPYGLAGIINQLRVTQGVPE